MSARRHQVATYGEVTGLLRSRLPSFDSQETEWGFQRTQVDMKKGYVVTNYSALRIRLSFYFLALGEKFLSVWTRRLHKEEVDTK